MGAFRYTSRSFVREVVMILAAMLFAMPLYFLIAISLKTDQQLTLEPLKPPLADPNWGNFADAWSSGGTTGGMGRAFLNTVIITVGSVVCLVLVSSLTAYVIARRTSRVSNGLYVLFVIGFIMPLTLGLVPIYVVMRSMGLLATYHGIIILHTAGILPFAVFLYVGFIRALPTEYEEAAQVDGAGMFRTFFKVVIPLLRPITTTVAMLSGLIVWNDFFLALIFMSGSSIGTLPIALNSFVNENYTQWNLVFAGATIAILPMLAVFIVAQRQFVRGLAGGIRG
ncbi:MAG: carbohydrate ABC transporter permease [Spirillospora sp.]